MKVLITGITGFAGSHMAEYCLNRGDIEVFGLVRWRSRTENIDHISDQLNLVECDIRDGDSVRAALARVKPDRIFHLAAQSFVPASWTAPSETLTTNAVGQINIFEAMRGLGLDIPIQLACSSEEYGLVAPDEVPITEDNPLRPLSPYAVSKVTQDMLGWQYFKSYGLPVVRTRAFNHTGPRRGQVFVTSDFARQIAGIEAGKRPPVVEVGNLSAVRDFTDVRDVVHAYWLALEKGEPGEVYNVATGRGITIREMLDRLLSLTDKEVEIRPNPERMRPSDVELLTGSADKLTALTGWQPVVPFNKTLSDLLDWWRERV